jgi:hypothetical protein
LGLITHQNGKCIIKKLKYPALKNDVPNPDFDFGE